MAVASDEAGWAGSFWFVEAVDEEDSVVESIGRAPVAEFTVGSLLLDMGFESEMEEAGGASVGWFFPWGR